MREIRPSGSEGGARSIPCPYPIKNQVHGEGQGEGETILDAETASRCSESDTT